MLYKLLSAVHTEGSVSMAAHPCLSLDTLCYYYYYYYYGGASGIVYLQGLLGRGCGLAVKSRRHDVQASRPDTGGQQVAPAFYFLCFIWK